ncbi:protein adenylyltransferase SelO [Pseudoalteromonas luteoviolacea]|uniref:protein adenylyltransferase SelO n=1 Tax=Pseudoalteromonas luteoviolacea TaxID=43657 RepID=UPI00115035C1|nr:YdiU family protein [Pseudoalteromonas luteoviolacea]TQF72783.1 YdiU family protein [Pseudoalteromonas luteoviolacea]
MMFYSRYTKLGAEFAVPANPEAFEQAKLLLLNKGLNTDIGPTWDNDEALGYLSGQQIIGNTESVSLAYSGHQFGHFNPLLGDGRAHLLASFKGLDGNDYDIQLKGSGATTFSRGGDGLCALGPAVREFIMSQAMYGLGVPTTHCLAVLSTGKSVYRQGYLPGALVARIARSHIRVGSFQLLALRQDTEAMHELMELAISDAFTEITVQGEDRIFAFFNSVCQAQCALMLKWLQVGFVHGVMNTDNTLVNGETIDYGPCAMMESFSFSRVYSSIDTQGRYAFGQQPNIASWNCARLAESLLLLCDDEEHAINRFSEILAEFSESFNQGYRALWQKKLGLLGWHDEDQSLINELLELMTKHQLDYTNTFASLTAYKLGALQEQYPIPCELDGWLRIWLERTAKYSSEAMLETMQVVNPAIIPRNELVEEVIQEYYQVGTSHHLNEWLEALNKPYEYRSYPPKWLTPQSNTTHYQTFCGT